MSAAASVEAVASRVDEVGRRAEHVIASLDGWTGVAASQARSELIATAAAHRGLVAAGGEVAEALRRLEADLAEVTAVRQQAASASDDRLSAALTATADELADEAARRAASGIDAATAALAPLHRHHRRHHWWDGPAHWAGSAWHAAEDAGSTFLGVAGALSHHGDDVGQVTLDALGTALGLALTAAGTGVESGGVALDATGVGAIAGVPLNIAGIAMMAAGGGLAAGSGAEFGKDARRLADEVREDLRAAPDYDVTAHEGIRGVHVLERHVGLTDEELVDRLRRSPQIEGASTFDDAETAQRWIRQALDRDWPQVEKWLSDGTLKDGRVTVRFDEPIGRTIMRESWENGGAVEPGHGLELVLRRASDAPHGFVVRTVKIYP